MREITTGHGGARTAVLADLQTQPVDAGLGGDGDEAEARGQVCGGFNDGCSRDGECECEGCEWESHGGWWLVVVGSGTLGGASLYVRNGGGVGKVLR